MDLSEDERVFVTAASGFVEKELRPAIAPFVREHRFPTPLVRSLCPGGLHGHFLRSGLSTGAASAPEARRCCANCFPKQSRVLQRSIFATAHP